MLLAFSIGVSPTIFITIWPPSKWTGQAKMQAPFLHISIFFSFSSPIILPQLIFRGQGAALVLLYFILPNFPVTVQYLARVPVLVLVLYHHFLFFGGGFPFLAFPNSLVRYRASARVSQEEWKAATYCKERCAYQ